MRPLQFDLRVISGKLEVIGVSTTMLCSLVTLFSHSVTNSHTLLQISFSTVPDKQEPPLRVGYSYYGYPIESIFTISTIPLLFFWSLYKHCSWPTLKNGKLSNLCLP